MPPVQIDWNDRHLRFRSLLRASSERAPVVTIAPDDPALLIYSGGTTGIAKGIVLSHYALIVNVIQVTAWGQVDRNDSTLAVLPFFHGFGMSVCMNNGLYSGGRQILLPRFQARQVARLIAKRRPTLLAAVPAMFIALKSLPDFRRYDLTSLRGIFVGAAPTPLAVLREFEELTGAALIEGYGLTEAVTAIACNPLHGTRKPGTIGIPFPDVEWRIVDLETGRNELPPGQAGEIILRCPELMTGYWNQPALTAETIRDGWLYTGDIGSMDEDGYVTIVDRKKDLVIVGGFNVFPSEIDEVLHQHPAVHEAVAVGLPHPVKGEYIKAYVVPREGQAPTEEEIIAFCRQNLSPYMVPGAVEFRRALPKSMIGKVLRQTLREEATGEL